MRLTDFRSALIAAAICGLGGYAFFLLNTPLPWMLGSLTASAITAIAGGRWFIPAPARNVARPIVGVLVGSAFSASVVASIPEWWSAILMVLVLTVAITLAGYLFFRTVGGFDRQTAFFAGAPGGLGELTLLGGAMGGDVRVIVIGHSIRIVMVLFSIPFILQLILGHPIGRVLPESPGDVSPTVIDWSVLALCAIAGYGLARAIKFPAGIMVFPMLLSAAVHATGLTQAVLPPWLVAIVQVAIGGVVGARFGNVDWREMRRAVAVSVVWAWAMIALAAAFAYIGTLALGRPFHAMMLALAPGGTIEMAILTYSIGIEVAFVVTCQVMRVLLVTVLVPVLFNLTGGSGTSPAPQ